MCCGWGEREFLLGEGDGEGGGSKTGMVGAGLRHLMIGLFAVMLVCSLVSVTSGAPTVVKDDIEIPLVRTKRSDEISFGNQQNEPRFKKSPPDHLIGGDEGAANDVIKQGSNVIGDTVASLTGKEGNEKEDSTVEEQKEEDRGSEASGPEGGNYVLDSADEDNAEEEGDETDKTKDHDDNDSDNAHDDDVTSNEKERRKRSPAHEAAPLFSKSSDHARSFISPAHPQPMKRSLSMMTAENMAGQQQNHAHLGRSKRDLGYDELRELLANQQGPAYEEYALPRYGYEEDDENEEVEDEDDDRYNPNSYVDYGDELGRPKRGGSDLPDYPDDSGEDFLGPSRKEQAIEKEILRYEVVRKLLQEKEAEQAKEAVLDYLIEAAEERVREAAEEEEKAEKEEEEDERERELMSRLAKRYPYSYEPYGGRWGAMVPGSKRDGTRESYERLYRLAQALNDNENEEDEERRK